jgi:hypothetical protein
MSNHNKRNALHIAAIHASTEMMDMLASANLIGLDVKALDKDGHSPNQCFVDCRSRYCAITRGSVEAEMESWARLMSSVRMQNDESSNIFDEKNTMDEGNEADEMSKYSRIERKDSFNISGGESESVADEEFVDAEETIT